MDVRIIGYTVSLARVPDMHSFYVLPFRFYVRVVYIGNSVSLYVIKKTRQQLPTV